MKTKQVSFWKSFKPWSRKAIAVLALLMALAAGWFPASAQDLSFLTHGLVAYYPFNGNANDESGNANHGTVYGAVLATDRFGNPNACFRFDGTSSYIKAAADPLPRTIRTVSLWFNADTVENQPVLMGYGGNGCETSFFMGLNLERLAHYYVGVHCERSSFLANDSSPQVNAWRHWVVVVDSNQAKMFIDGWLMTTFDAPFPMAFTSGRDLCLGVCVAPDGYGPFVDENTGYLQGMLDEVRIYNRALTDAEVKTLYEYNESSNTLPQVSYVKSEMAQVGIWSPGTNTSIQRVVRFGNRAFALDGNSDVHALDVSDPAKPTALGKWQPLFQAYDIEAAGNLVYVATWEPDFLSTVEIVDFSNPAKPVLRGYYDTDGYALDVAVAGNIAYVADGEAGLLILDVSDPAWPGKIGGYETLGAVRLVSVSGRYVYAVDRNWLLILDVSDPSNSRRINAYEAAGEITAIKATGGKLYLVDGRGTLQILDVTDPQNTKVLGSYPGWGGAGAVAASGKFAYVPLGSRGFQVLDVSDPAKPSYLTSAWNSPAWDVALTGQYALVAGGEKGLVVYELQQSLYPPLAPPVIADGTMTLTWATTNDVRLQKATNLVNAVWQDVPESEGTNTVTLPVTEGGSFFRLAKGPKLGQAIPPPPSMVAWWAGDGDALDLVGTNHGTLKNGTTFAEGKVELAFSLDGVHDYIALPSTNALYSPVNGFTWDAWVKPERLDEAVVVAVTDPAFASDYMLGVGGGGPHCPVLGQVWAQVDPDGGRLFFSAAAPNGLETDVWYHLALVVDFPNRHLELYANGQLIQSTDHRGNINNRNMWVTIGAVRDGPDAYPYDHFEGLIDEIHVFNRPLSASEISAIFNAGAAGLVKPSR